MHVLFLTDNFPPETNAPANRTFDHARAWVRAGHTVTVVTGAPNFPRGVVFDGYRNVPIRKETIEGIEVVRVWTYIAANRGFLKRTLDYLSFMASAIVASPFLAKPDVVIATSPQFFTAVAGFVVARLVGRPWVFELRDLWPESITAVGAMSPGRTLDALERLADGLYRDADLIVPVTRAFERHVVTRGADPRRVEVVTNGIDPEALPTVRPRDVVRDAHGIPRDAFAAGYIGTIGMAHGVGTLVEAARRVKGRDEIHFVAMGEGADKARVRDAVESSGLSNLTLLDGKPRVEALELLSALDVSLVMLIDSPLFETVIPSKIFEAMAFRKPIALGVRGESREIVVDRTRSGIAFTPGDADGLIEAVDRLRTDPALAAELADNGRGAVEREFSRSRLAERMIARIESMVAETRR